MPHGLSVSSVVWSLSHTRIPLPGPKPCAVGVAGPAANAVLASSAATTPTRTAIKMNFFIVEPSIIFLFVSYTSVFCWYAFTLPDSCEDRVNCLWPCDEDLQTCRSDLTGLPHYCPNRSFNQVRRASGENVSLSNDLIWLLPGMSAGRLNVARISASGML